MVTVLGKLVHLSDTERRQESIPRHEGGHVRALQEGVRPRDASAPTGRHPEVAAEVDGQLPAVSDEREAAQRVGISGVDA